MLLHTHFTSITALLLWSSKKCGCFLLLLTQKKLYMKPKLQTMLSSLTVPLCKKTWPTNRTTPHNYNAYGVWFFQTTFITPINFNAIRPGQNEWLYYRVFIAGLERCSEVYFWSWKQSLQEDLCIHSNTDSATKMGWSNNTTPGTTWRRAQSWCCWHRSATI